MKELEERILTEGKVLKGGILKVGSFLNQQIDTTLLKKIALDVYNHFKNVDKVFTIEASGIAFATMVASLYNVPVVFAKKHKSSNVTGDVYVSQVVSFTHGQTFDVIVSKDYFSEGSNVLIVDDFLATGSALNGLIDIVVNQAKCNLVGCAIEVEKEFQNGGNELRNKGIEVYSLARISKMTDDSVEFNNN